MPGLAILLGFNLLGLLVQAAGVPLPAGVIGLVLFVACLFAGVVKLRWVEPAADVLLRHMLLFFAPVIVGAIAFAPVLRAQWPAVLLGLVGGTLAVMLTTAFVARALVRTHADPDAAR
jgi:holin-like protein